VCACLALFGCLEEQRYAVERETVSLSEDDAPAFVDENDDPVFVAQRNFTLQIRPPRDERLQQLAEQAQGLDLPFSRLPWVEQEAIELQVDYALENRSAESVAVMLFIDGRNEFHVYTPGPGDFHQWERRFLLEPGGRKSGVITELEMDEVAVDLATVVNGAPNTAQVVHTNSQSGRDPRVSSYIPAVIPALVGMAIVHYVGQATATPAFPFWSLGRMLLAGALLSVASQVGDLAESCLKRDANVKDSGNIFPGHGGVLDRCDGFLFAAPVLYYLVHAWRV